MISTHNAMTGFRAAVRRRKVSRSVAAVALLAGVSAGCGALPNDARSVDNLQATLTSMPGVTDAWVYHEESYSQGLVVKIAVDVSTATSDQIAQVAERIGAVQLGMVDNYSQTVEFWVTPDRAVTVERNSRLDSRQIADDSDRLREMAAGTDGRISWFRSDDGMDSRLSFEQSHSSGPDLLNLVRRTVGRSEVTVTVSPNSAARPSPQLLVGLPLDPDAQRLVFDSIEAIAVPVLGVRVDRDALSVLQVVVPGTDSGEGALLDAVAASRKVAARSWWLAWYFPTFAGRAPAFGGIVHIGDCATVPAAVIHDASMHHAGDDDGTSLQARVQSQIDNCPASMPATTPSAGSTPGPPTTTAPAHPPAVPVIDTVTPSPTAGTSTTRGVTVGQRSVASPCPARPANSAPAGCPSAGPGQPVSTRPPLPKVPVAGRVLPAAGLAPDGLPPAALGARPADSAPLTRRTTAARSDRR